MRFMLNEEKFETLSKLRGWRSRYSDLALALGMTRSYVRRVLVGEEKMTELFMLRYIRVAGANPENPKEWGALFIPVLNDDDHEMAFNFPKLKDQIPYKALSVSAEFRRQDNPDVEVLEYGK